MVFFRQKSSNEFDLMLYSVFNNIDNSEIGLKEIFVNKVYVFEFVLKEYLTLVLAHSYSCKESRNNVGEHMYFENSEFHKTAYLGVIHM